MSAAIKGVITREEWMRRYAARIVERAGWDQPAADSAAIAGAEAYERDQGSASWFGVTADGQYSPEDEADEEMSCWTDDEGSET